MKKNYSYLLAVLLIFNVGCKKDNTNNPSSGSSTNFPLFTGYTSTDNSGVPMGLTDPTDWINDTNWLPSEENLFPQYQNLINDFEHDTTIQIYPAYPNPTSSVTFFQLSKESDVRFSFRVVNKNFNTIASADSLYINSFGINTIDIASPTDTMVRIYYFFERNDSCLYKGHGDIKIN